MIIGHDEHATDEYECHWAAPTSNDVDLHRTLESSYVFLNYFRKLKRIGKYAFRGIGGIRTIKLNPMIITIGAGSLIPPDTELLGENIPQTKLLWETGSNTSYSTMTIQEQAFLGRDFIWQSTIGGYNGTISHAVFIPSSVNIIESYVFSPTGGGLANGSNARLEYVLTDASEESIGIRWSTSFAASPMLREAIYGYKTTIIGKSTYAQEFTRSGYIQLDPVIDYDPEDHVTILDRIPKVFYDFAVNPNTGHHISDFAGLSQGDIYINILNETNANHGNWEVYRYYDAMYNGEYVAWKSDGELAKPENESGFDRELTDDDILPVELEERVDANGLTSMVYSFGVKYRLHYQRNNAMYFIYNNSAMYTKLLETSASVTIPKDVTYGERTYPVKKIAQSAFIDNGSALNAIVFDRQSELISIGGSLFTTTQINRIEVDGTGGSQIIPTSVASVGSGTPYKDTVWFSGQHASDFVYLNDVCIGYWKGDDEIELENNPDVHIRAGTKIIYDGAFKSNRNLTSIVLPSSLERIEVSAFEDCNALRSIDFHVCKEKLSYIGDGAFKNCNSLTEMTYTKKITHVGKNAMFGNTSISKYVFEKGCAMDSTSDPIYLSLDPDTGLNTSITDLRIAKTMGSYFAPGAPGETVMSKLSQLKTLILGDYTTIDITNTLTNIDGDDKYVIDLTTIWPSATTVSDGQTIPVVLEVDESDLPDGVIYKGAGEYEDAINIGGVTRNTLKQINVIQTAMGINPNLGHPVTIIAKNDVTGI